MIDLYEHNYEAYENAVSMLAANQKAAIIHPTGTGKSFIGFKLCEDNPDSVFCWLSPSEYIFKTQLENVRKAADGYEPDNIRFFTYAKLMLMSETEIAAIKPDYIILDEFHRCGAAMWGKGVQTLLNACPGTPVLGLSATNIRYLDNQRDMADELFGGNIASKMTLGEAVVRGILKPPTYVTTIYSYQNDIEKFQRRIQNTKNKAVRGQAEKQLDALRRALENADGLDVVFQKYITEKSGKYLVFCANKEHMDEMAAHTGEWFGRIDEAPHVYQAYSSEPETSKEFAEFKADESGHLKLLFCIDMLNEGVHVEDISGVILFRPTVSPIIYKQQIGRAMSAGSKKNAVILDIVNNIENLYSVGAICDEMQNAIDFYRYYGEDAKIVNESFTVIDEVYDCRRLFDELEDMLSASWDLMYLEAKKYFKENGDLLPDTSYVTELGYPLGQWIATQRSVYRGTGKGRLSAERIKQLEAIGMSWLTRNERLWEENYRLAKAFYEKNGNLDVCEDNLSLYHWILRQRKKYRDGQLAESEYAALSDIGMIWEIESAWDIHFPEAKKFFERNGHLDIPAGYVTENGMKLGAWYRTIRGLYKDNMLSADKQQELEQIGMQRTSVKERTWRQYYELAKAYYEKHGDLAVHVKYTTENGKNLGIWISSQRYAKKKGALSGEQIELLEKIGMSWHQFSSKWKIGFEYAERYCEEHGNLEVPADYVNDDGFKLGAWIATQRNKHRKNKLKLSQIKRLEELKIDWNPNDTAWERAFAEAKRYYETHHTINVKDSCVTDSGFCLGSWIANQRTNYRQKKLTDEQVKRLEACGIWWSVTEEKWNRGYAHAVNFYRENGHLKMSKNYITSDGFELGSWISIKRAAYKKGKLGADKVEQLEKIGMVWNPYEEKWEQAYSLAKQYYSNYGDLNHISALLVVDEFPIGEWLRGQQRQYEKGRLQPERKEKLEKLGIVFQNRSTVNRKVMVGDIFNKQKRAVI